MVDVNGIAINGCCTATVHYRHTIASLVLLHFTCARATCFKEVSRTFIVCNFVILVVKLMKLIICHLLISGGHFFIATARPV